MSWQEDVRRDYEEVRKHFKSTKFTDFRTGRWFGGFVRWVLSNYAERVDAQYYQDSLPWFGASSPGEARNQVGRKVQWCCRRNLRDCYYRSGD